MRERVAKLWRDAPATWLLLGLFVCLCLAVVAFELEPPTPLLWSRAQNDIAIGVCSALTGVLLLLFGALRGVQKRAAIALQRAAPAVLAVLVLASGALYFYGARGATHISFTHVHDAFHYYLGPKYYAELDYGDLYKCAVAGLDETTIPRRTKLRDLSNESMGRIEDRRAQFLAECRPKFSEARWSQWQRDLQVFARANRNAVHSSLGDKGYNGTPFHSFVAGTVANGLDRLFGFNLAFLMLLPLLDALGICVVLSAVCRAFGYRLGLLACVFFFTSFVDRHVIIGGSFMRYAWLGTLVLGIVALKRDQYARAGGWLAVAGALNVFPILFAAALPLHAAWQLVTKRAFERPHLRFILALCLVGAACTALGAVNARGIGNYQSFAQEMRLHNVAGRIPGFGVGLKYDLLYRGEHDKANYAKKAKLRELHQARGLLYTMTALILGFILWLLPRSDKVETSILLGFALVFCVFGPTGYYYAFAFLLVLMWHRRMAEGGAILLLALLFGLNAIACVLSGTVRNLFLVYNTVASMSFTVYLALVLAYLGVRTGRLGEAAHWFSADKQQA